MIRKLSALLYLSIATLGLTGMAYAQETEETAGQESSSVSIWQGYLDSVSYTFFLDAESQTASVSETSSDGALSSFAGTYAIDEEGTLVITSQDGSEVSWKASSVSACQNTVSGVDLLSGQEVEVTLVKADPEMVDSVNEYAWYAGLSEEGDAYTYGISPDCTDLIFAFYTPEEESLYRTEFSLDITDSGNGVLTGQAADQEEGVYSFSYEMIGENPLRVVITLNGEDCETSAVEARIIPGYTQEQAGVS